MKSYSNPFQEPNKVNTYQALVQDEIIECSSLIGAHLYEISVYFPPKIDNLDTSSAKITWRARIGSLPENWPNEDWITGRLHWPEIPEEDILRKAVRRSCLFAALIGLTRERSFIYAAIEAYRYRLPDEEGVDLMDAVYRMNVLGLVRSGITYDASGNSAGHGKLPPLAKILNFLIKATKKRSIDFLSHYYGKMKADLDRENSRD